MQLTRAHRAAAERGFTLIELLVTLVVCAVGLLGLGKLQATALAESQTSRTRALMTFQAEGLAGAMRANPAYWAATTTPLPGFTVSAGNATPTDNAGTMTLTASCVGTSANCTPQQMAGSDVTTWASTFVQQFPSGTATVACNTTNGPVSCDITLSWAEHYVAMNRTTANAAATAVASNTSRLGNSLVLHVQP